MKYDKILHTFLSNSPETVEQFCIRAGVHRSSVYRALNGKSLRFAIVEKLLGAAGYRIEAIPMRCLSTERPQEPPHASR